MSIPRLMDLVLWYGTPSLLVLSLFLIWLFIYLGKRYKTPEEAMLKFDRDGGIMLLAMRLLVVSEFMGIVMLIRGC